MDHDDKACKHCVRRGFLLSLGWAMVGLVSGGMAWIAANFLSGSRVGYNDGPVLFGAVDDFAVGAVVASGRVVLFRDEAGFWAVQATCPHLGCQPLFDKDRNSFQCPCHGSRFDSEGRLLTGPASRGMNAVALRKDSKGSVTAYPDECTDPGFRLRT